MIIDTTKRLEHLSVATPLGIKNMTHLHLINAQRQELGLGENKIRMERREGEGVDTGSNSLIP